jgi:hypothetical protein
LRNSDERPAGRKQRRNEAKPHLSTPARAPRAMGLVRSDREGGDRRAIPKGIANGLASPSASRPLRVSAGLRACEWIVVLETAPSRARSTVVRRGLGLAYRCVGSAGIAFVWRMRTGFPFHPKGAFCAPGTPETGGTLRGCIQACKLASSGPRAGGRRLSGTAAVTRQSSAACTVVVESLIAVSLIFRRLSRHGARRPTARCPRPECRGNRRRAPRS